MISVSPSTPSTKGLVVSLDDQLEWQQSARSHSPRTPTPPEILRSLRKTSSPPTPSRWQESENCMDDVGDITAFGNLDTLIKLTGDGILRTAVVRGEFLCLRDGSSLPLAMLIPLQVRVVERREDSSDTALESIVPLSVGSAWLSVVAEHTYESQLASLLRSRKGISEIVMEDRRILNRFLLGKLSLTGLKASGLWGSVVDASEKDTGLVELGVDSDDILSTRLKRKSQLESLEERKVMLHDQQNRLRKLLARELQRMHSMKPAPAVIHPPLPSPTPVNGPSVPVANHGEVSSVVANMLKRFKPKNISTIEPPSPEPELVQCSERSADPGQLNILQAKFRAINIEWYRVSEKLRLTIEQQQVLERKIKRMRYDSSKLAFIIANRIEESDAVKIVSA